MHWTGPPKALDPNPPDREVSGKWRTVGIALAVLALLSSGCATLSEQDAIDFVAGFGGEADYDPCTDDGGDPATVDRQCVATQTVTEKEREKQASDLTVDALEAIADQDFEAARAHADKVISLRPADRDGRGLRIAIDLASGADPSPVDLVAFSVNRDPLDVQGDLAIVYGKVLNYLFLNDGAPETIETIADAYCEVRAIFEFNFERLPIKDRTRELISTNIDLQAHRQVKSLQSVTCLGG